MAGTPGQAEAIRGTRGTRLLLAVLSLAGTAVVLISTSHHGAGLTPDSVVYVSVARNLVHGSGLVDFGGHPLASYAPLYPILLALASLVTRLDPLSCAPIVNAILFGGMIYLSGLLLAQYLTRSSTLLFLGAVSVLVSRQLVGVSVMALSEPFFICCLLLLLLYTRPYIEGASTGSLMAMSFSAAAAPLIRYAGLIIIPVGIIVILSRGGTRLKTRLFHLAGFLCVSVAPQVIWWVTWVNMRTGWLPRSNSMYAFPSLLEGLGFVGLTVLSWFGRRHLSGLALIRTASSAVLASELAVAGLVLLSRAGASRLWPRMKAALREAGPLFLFIVLYVPFIMLSNVVAGSEISDRLLSPIYVPIIVLMFIFLDRSTELLRTVSLRRNARTGLSAVICIWLLVPAIEVGRDSLERNRLGAGYYNTVSWRESPTIDFVEQLAPSARIVLYSNAPDVLYILGDIKARWSPGRPARSLESMERGAWPEEGAGLLVWFSRATAWRPDLLSPAELQSVAGLDTLAKLDDGVVFLVSRR